MHKQKFFVVPSVIFLTIFVAAAVLSVVDYSWSHWKPATCMPDDCFCEAIRSGAVAQPSNTWSSFSFVLLGLLIIGKNRQDVSLKRERARSNPMTRHTAHATVYGISLVIIGLGSAFYHASLTFVGQCFDVMGMYLLASFILLYNLFRLSPLDRPVFVMAYVTLNLILGYILVQFPELRRYLFGMLVVAAMVAKHHRRRKIKPNNNEVFIQVAALTLIAAFVLWVLDLTKILCAPNSWLQGHALWHVLGALAAGFLYLYYRSETAK
jgi:hypothetical protein